MKCRSGGIGRRAGFRCLWSQDRVGSSPISCILFFAKNILYPSKLFQSKIPGFSEQFQNSRDFIVTVHSVHSNLVKMHSKSPSVIAFCPVCLGILPYSWQNTSRDITCEQLQISTICALAVEYRVYTLIIITYNNYYNYERW